MSIDPLTETVLTLAQAAKRLPRLRNNRPVAVSTLWRWARSGCRGRILETLLVGRVRVTSPGALTRFFAALSAPQAPPQETGSRSGDAETELDELGI
jgi:hypothetical protein